MNDNSHNSCETTDKILINGKLYNKDYVDKNFTLTKDGTYLSNGYIYRMTCDISDDFKFVDNISQ